MEFSCAAFNEWDSVLNSFLTEAWNPALRLPLVLNRAWWFWETHFIMKSFSLSVIVYRVSYSSPLSAVCPSSWLTCATCDLIFFPSNLLLIYSDNSRFLHQVHWDTCQGLSLSLSSALHSLTSLPWTKLFYACVVPKNYPLRPCGIFFSIYFPVLHSHSDLWRISSPC